MLLPTTTRYTLFASLADLSRARISLLGRTKSPMIRILDRCWGARRPTWTSLLQLSSLRLLRDMTELIWTVGDYIILQRYSRFQWICLKKLRHTLLVMCYLCLTCCSIITIQYSNTRLSWFSFSFFHRFTFMTLSRNMFSAEHTSLPTGTNMRLSWQCNEPLCPLIRSALPVWYFLLYTCLPCTFTSFHIRGSILYIVPHLLVIVSSVLLFQTGLGHI